MKIAILGATSHIAKGLIVHFTQKDRYELFLFARSRERAADFLRTISARNIAAVSTIDEFGRGGYDVVINCVGIGQPAKLKADPGLIFSVTEFHDNLVIEYLARYPACLYINFSSGAVYGANRSQPATDDTDSLLHMNHLAPENYYMVAKINSEAKHRSLSALNIVDLRIFAYFSRFIDLASQYVITDMITCIQNGKEFITGPNNMVRDYIHPRDLFALVEKCIERLSGNDAFDAYSLKPIDKFAMLACFQKEFGLTYTVDGNSRHASATGEKDVYYSVSRKAQALGYDPHYTSFDSVQEESRALLAASGIYFDGSHR